MAHSRQTFTCLRVGLERNRTRSGSTDLPLLPALERPETPPSPLSTVPFARDPDFVSRETLLDQIHDKSLVLGSRIALVGLGGVGLV